MVARDQHQPASSRAMATLATNGFLPRSVKLRHRLLRRRLPACPRARSAGSTFAQRARRVGPEVLWDLRWCQADSISSRRTWVLPALVIGPCTGELPEEYSQGTKPT